MKTMNKSTGYGHGCGETTSDVESKYAESEPMPCRSEPSSPREIQIRPLNSGYFVRVGCQEVAVESTEKLISTLSAYLYDTDTFEKEWYSKNTRNRLDNITFSG